MRKLPFGKGNKDLIMSDSKALKDRVAVEDRPREKAKARGFGALDTSELLAILVGSGARDENVVDLCKRILNDNDDRLYNLARLSIRDLMRYRGIGEVKAIELLAALELARRYHLEDLKELPQITPSTDAYRYLRCHLQDLDHEEIWVMLLNRAHRVTHCLKISSGGTSSTVGDVKIILRTALEHLADAIVLAHNHPSDNPTPSAQDDDLPRSVKNGCEAVGISLLDHIIVCRAGRYHSYNDSGKL